MVGSRYSLDSTILALVELVLPDRTSPEACSGSDHVFLLSAASASFVLAVGARREARRKEKIADLSKFIKEASARCAERDRPCYLHER